MRNFYAATSVNNKPYRKEGSTHQQALNALSQELSRLMLTDRKNASLYADAWKNRVSGPTAI